MDHCVEENPDNSLQLTFHCCVAFASMSTACHLIKEVILSNKRMSCDSNVCQSAMS